MKEKKISVVVPCYYSENTLVPIIHKIEDVLTRKYYEYEIILIDDGSKDNTYKKIQELSKGNQKIKGIKFSQNFGQHAALIAGYAHVTGDIVVGLNDDGEHNPEDIPTLVEKLEEGYDYVCAKHQLKKHTIIQKLGSTFNNFCCINLLGQPKNFRFSSYYAMNRFLIEEIIKNENPFINVNGLILSITKRVTDIEIPAYERKSGVSGYTIRKSVLLWANSFTAFTIVPLRISIYVGMILALLSVICIVYSLVILFFGISNMPVIKLMEGFVLGVFGLNFLALGIIGEYIGRVYMVVSGARQYIVAETINLK